jgi:hypothetical protein
MWPGHETNHERPYEWKVRDGPLLEIRRSIKNYNQSIYEFFV